MKKLATTDERLSQVTVAHQNDRYRNNLNVFRAKNQSTLQFTKQSKALTNTHRSALDQSKPLGTSIKVGEGRSPPQETNVFRITLSKKPETMVEHAAEFDETSVQTNQLASSQQVKVIKIHAKPGSTDNATHRRLLTQAHPPQRESIRAKNQTLGPKKAPSGKLAETKPQSSFNSLDHGNSSRLTRKEDEEKEPRETDFLLDCIEDVDQTILKIQGPYRPLGMINSSSKNSLYTTGPTSLVPFVLLSDQGERPEYLLRLPDRWEVFRQRCLCCRSQGDPQTKRQSVRL